MLFWVQNSSYAFHWHMKWDLRQVIEFSSNSTWLLVESWLFCIQDLLCSVNFWCMLGGSVEVWMKNILYWSIKGQVHFGMPRVAKIYLDLNELKLVAFHSNSNTTSKNAPQVERNYWFCMQSKQWNSIGDQFLTKSPIAFKGETNVLTSKLEILF